VVTKLFLLIIAAEALSWLWFNGTPIQPLRKVLMRLTPFFNSVEKGHLMNCLACISMWIGFAMAGYYFYLDQPWTWFILFGLIIGRWSKVLNTVITYLEDKHLDLLIARGKHAD